MNTRDRVRILVPAGVLVLACVVTGCTPDAGAGPEGSPGPAASDSPTSEAPPSAAEDFAYPETDDPTQAGIALKYDGDDPSGEIIAGPAVLVADRPFSVEGQCEGDDVGFEVMTADGEKRVIADGAFDCASPPAGEYTYQLPYAGPIQVNLTDTEGVDRAWVRVVQP
jgi:hypothetical protein